VLTLSEAREALREVFTHDRVVELWSAIKDLKSRFPPYAADPVATTLWDWCLWAGAHMSGRMAHEGEAGDGDLVASRLRRQGQTWRALLSGERKPPDCLQFGNYAEAAGHLLRNYWKLVGRGLGRRWGTVLFVLLMVAVAVAVAVAVQQVAHSYVASLAGALTALGVTGASAVAALKRALDQAEHALWETEMAAAVAVAIGFVPQRLPHSAAARLATDDPRPIGPALER